MLFDVIQQETQKTTRNTKTFERAQRSNLQVLSYADPIGYSPIIINFF